MVPNIMEECILDPGLQPQVGRETKINPDCRTLTLFKCKVHLILGEHSFLEGFKEAQVQEEGEGMEMADTLDGGMERAGTQYGGMERAGTKDRGMEMVVT